MSWPVNKKPRKGVSGDILMQSIKSRATRVFGPDTSDFLVPAHLSIPRGADFIGDNIGDKNLRKRARFLQSCKDQMWSVTALSTRHQITKLELET